MCRRHSAALRGGAARRGIAVGFDDGELITVGVHSKSGFAAQSLAAPRKKKRRKLAPGEYFKLEGGREVLMCDCTDAGLPRELFQAHAPLDPLSLSATICPAWPNQHGTLGTLYPFICEFVTAAAASAIATAFPGEVQFHELTIAERPGEWRIMKVLHCVTCFDREAYYQQQRLRLRKDALGGHNIFSSPNTTRAVRCWSAVRPLSCSWTWMWLESNLFPWRRVDQSEKAINEETPGFRGFLQLVLVDRRALRVRLCGVSRRIFWRSCLRIRP